MLLKTSYKMKPPVSARLVPGHPLADKLIACYLMNEGSGVKAHDSSGRGHHGTLTGGATWATGKFGRAVDFDGTGGHIVIPDHDDFTPALTPFSVSAWVCMHDASSFHIVSKGVLNTNGEWLFQVDTDDLLRVYFMDESVATCFIGRVYNTALTGYENSRIQVVITYDGGTLSSGVKIYLNGARVDDANNENAATSFVSVENLTGPVWVGRYSTFYANGVIDNVMIWRRVLTQSDINRLYVNPFCMFEQRQRVGG